MKCTLITLLLIGLGHLSSTHANELGDLENYMGHAIALHNTLKYDADFSHFEYVNPDAPKGGTLRLATIGTYDSLHPFILQGSPSVGLGLIYDTLLTRSSDEAFSEYGLLAERVEVPPDGSWVAFYLRPEATWHDGEPITSEDVVFSFNTLITDGHPFYQSYYGSVVNAEAIDEHTVKFTFEGDINKELPLIMGQLIVLPEHYWRERDFTEPTLEPPLGSGPYRILDVDAGRGIRYERVDDYWGADLPVNVGKNNFDVISYDYYRDTTVSIEALRAYEYDFRSENIAREWATAYDIPEKEEGLFAQELIPNENNQGMQAFWFNTRRDKFADANVREALAYAFDFEWTNETLFFGQYTRTDSFFENSELASSGLPTGLELEILEPYRDQLPEDIFTTPYELPVSDGSGTIRDGLRTARSLLAEAGWEVQDGVLTNTETGDAMEIEFLLIDPNFERIVAPFIQNLERLGVTATIRTVDQAQYQNLVQDFDFDIIVSTMRQSLNPGNEQRDMWSSEVANTTGSRNLAGIQDPVVDALIEDVISAPDRETLVATTHALDRVLLNGHYIIPQWHIAAYRLAFWDKFGRPEIAPKYSLGFITWWIDDDKLAAIQAAN
ncbi:MAG: extracellular solute-binding protein [Deinococcota bacterium]